MAINDMTDEEFITKYEECDKDFLYHIITLQNEAHHALNMGRIKLAANKYSLARFLMGIDDYNPWE